MAVDFSTINAAVQTQVDAATRPLNDTIASLKTQLATAQQEAIMFYWFKSDAAGATTIYVYNPITGRKRAITTNEWTAIQATTPAAVAVTIKDADVKAIPTA
jgi:hypothetical protein